jgi:hypothetical protein
MPSIVMITFNPALDKSITVPLLVPEKKIKCSATGTNILALMHHQHSFFIRFLNQSATKEALLNQSIPSLVIPSKIDE